MKLQVRDDKIIKQIMEMSENDKQYYETFAVKGGCEVKYSSAADQNINYKLDYNIGDSYHCWTPLTSKSK